MMKILKDAIGQTIFVLGFMYLISLIPFQNFDLFNPVSKAFGDFQLTDIVFAHFKQNSLADTNIVLVNIGDKHLGRGALAEEIEIINKCEPKVIGIDAFFRKPKDPEQDSALAAAMSKVKHLVLVSKVTNYNEISNTHDSLETSHPMFMAHAESAMSNMISEGYDKFRTARNFTPYEKIKDTIEYAFGVKLADIYDHASVERLLKRKNETEIINFIGNFNPGVIEGTHNSSLKYTALDVSDVFNAPEEDLKNVLKGKIVLIGYLGDDFTTNHTWGDDKFFTPLNSTYIGKALPDMYGVVVHANIISMILRGNYINEMPEYMGNIISVILILINCMLFTYLYKKLEIWYDAGNLLFTLFEIILIGFAIGLVFDLFDYKFDVTLALIGIALLGNLTEIYHGLIKLLYKKYRNKFIPLPSEKTQQLYEN